MARVGEKRKAEEMEWTAAAPLATREDLEVRDATERLAVQAPLTKATAPAVGQPFLQADGQIGVLRPPMLRGELDERTGEAAARTKVLLLPPLLRSTLLLCPQHPPQPLLPAP